MAGTQEYDYSDIKNDWLDSGFRMSAENRRELQRLSHNIAETYSISDRDAHEDLATCDSGRGEDFVAEFVLGDELELFWRCFENKANAFFIDGVNGFADEDG